MRKYLHIITGFFAAHWAIMPEKLDAMASFLRFAGRGGKYSQDEVEERIGARHTHEMVLLPAAASGSVQTGQPQTIAVIPIQGIIDQKAARVEDISGPGGTSTEKTAKAFRAAVNDESVKAIVFDVDSPGGTVYGVPELADEILKARGKKPIVAVVNSLAASAAYWLASQAEEVVITPAGEAGSVGVYSMHTDISKFLENEGTKITFIKAGEFKAEGNPYEPLSEEAIAYIQTRVDEYYAMFTKAVSKGRGVPVARVKSDFGKGRVLGAQDALAAGMVDRIATFDQTIERLAGKRGGMKAEDEALPRPVAVADAPSTKIEDGGIDANAPAAEESASDPDEISREEDLRLMEIG